MTTPSSNPAGNGTTATEALDSVLIEIDGPVDTTRRPRRPNIPLTPPRREKTSFPKPEEKDPDSTRRDD